jgi:hypothetical protein
LPRKFAGLRPLEISMTVRARLALLAVLGALLAAFPANVSASRLPVLDAVV